MSEFLRLVIGILALANLAVLSSILLIIIVDVIKSRRK